MIEENGGRPVRKDQPARQIGQILSRADALHGRLGTSVHDRVSASVYSAAERLSARNVVRAGSKRFDRDAWIDRRLTSPLIGFPAMILLLAAIFWLTVRGVNVPSAFLAGLLMEEGGLQAFFTGQLGWSQAPDFLGMSLYEGLHHALSVLRAPAWLSGFFVDGVYLGVAWVVAVMLPPMAIFFPLFTLLEDLGFLPRVAFNLDRFFRSAGAHGKQALTMAMGLGCNAAGVIACRIIDSPRERLVAILTNTFIPCNGRWPTLILMATILVSASAAHHTTIAVAALTALTLTGVAVTLAVSWILTRTLLKGSPSSFTLEMPPFRRPQIGRILYTSLIDRTLFVLRRAVICAAPAGGLIWLLGAVRVDGHSLFQLLAGALQPLGQALGMDGLILLAFIFAIPANEIVIPTLIMGYMNLSRMTEIADPAVLFAQNGWTGLTVLCVMLFSLLHYPCTTVTLTVWAETKQRRWTLLSNLIPLAVAAAVCFTVALCARMLGWAG
jgi:ferrous iron transport protein B